MAKDEVKKDAPAEKLFSQEDMQSAVKNIAKSMMEEMLPAMMAMQVAGQKGSYVAPSPSRLPPGEVCQDCRQLKVACGGEHIMMVVYPVNRPEYADWFQGAIINGVRYLSNDGVHHITVPKVAQGGILKMIQDYEENERVTRLGRVKEHNSGSVNAPNRAAVGWR